MEPTQRKIDLASFYNLVYAPRGFSLAPHHYPIIAGVEDERIDNLLFLGPAGTGKSSLLCNIVPAWVLGHDPTMTVLSVSAGEKLPQGFMASTMQIIQHDRVWKELFPEVRPSPDLGWSIQRGLFVTGHHPSDPDASYMSAGIQSKALTGLHARLHIYDDLHDRENSNTADARATVIRAYYDTLMGRADPRGCRRIAAGRWWAPDDLYQEWIAGGDWVVLQLPASRPGQVRLWYDVFVPHDLKCVYTETLEPDPVQDITSNYIRYRAYYGAVDPLRRGFYWPASKTKRSEYEAVLRRQPRIAAVNYNGNMSGAGGDAVFLETDFRPYVAPIDLELGVSAPAVHEWTHRLNGEVEQAWDTALGQSQSASFTVALTGLFVPCQHWHCGEDSNIIGPCDFHYDVYLMNAMVKDLDFRELAMALRAEYAKWAPITVTVEEKQSGVGLIQTFRGSHIPIRGQKVEQGKIERAINPVLQGGLPVPGGAASVQGWARMGRVLYPVGASWITEGPDGLPEHGFLRKVLNYKGGLRANDEFDALVHLVTRAIVRSRRRGKLGVTEVRDELTLEAAEALNHDPRYAVLERMNSVFAQQHDPILNPFNGFCGACDNYAVKDNREWCCLHTRATTTFGGCSYWREKIKLPGVN